MFAAIVGYGTLGMLVAWAVSGEKPPREASSGEAVEGIPSVDSPAFADWISANNGKNLESYLLSFDKK
jgi:hypothetical protein